MFKGQKVLLRAITCEDMQRQWIAENDPELFYLDGGKPRPISLEDLYRDFEQNSRRNDEIEFAIEADGKYIGHCGLRGFNTTTRTAELGIEISDKAYWGQGYGRDAIRLLLDYAFTHMNMHRVHLTTHSENERAIRCYKACGFVEEGRMRQHLYVRGHYVDRVMMGVLREEFVSPSVDPV